MSVAFTREESAETAAEAELPDRPISPHLNLVTAHGLKLLEAALNGAQIAYAAAQTVEDINERRRASVLALRDLRYFSERVKSAQVRETPAVAEEVGFGRKVTFERADGRTQTFQIVGEDEADPAAGTISYVSPVASALRGKRVGDVGSVNGQDIEIISIA